jgi:zinc protease
MSTNLEIPALPPGTRSILLDNGLGIILREDHTAPVVSAQVWCKAGSIDEGRWLGAGLSHMLEHMLFKGTSTRGAGRIDQEIQDAGGSMNAYTSFDRTVYYINVPNTGTQIALDILCDIVQNATLPPDEMAKEQQVILREMDMNQDDPSRRASRRLFEVAYTKSPYRYTVIGYPDIFNEVRREDVLAYYREKYQPDNLFFVVVGDMSAEAVEKQIRQAFAHVKARPVPPVVLPQEPKQAAQREVIEEAPIELGYFHYAWHIPDIRHADLPAIELLSTVLGSGHSSRLYQQVREKHDFIHAADAWTYNPGNPGLFGMSAVVDATKLDQARDAILVQLERVKQELVPEAELGKAVKQFISATLSTRKTMQGQAQDLGANWLSASDLNFSERFLAAAKRTTPADLQRVAQTYLTTENRTLYALLPTGAPRQEAAPESAFLDHPIRKFELPNGLRLLVKQDHRLPFVEIRTALIGGVLAETGKNNGATLLLSKTLLKGTPTRTAEQIVTEMESMGGSMDAYSGNNSLGLYAEMLSSDFSQGLELVSDVLLNPIFPEAALEREKAVQLASIRGLRDQLLQSASRAMRQKLYGPRAYGFDIFGTEETVSQIRISDLKSLHQRLVIPNNCVLAIYGDIDPDRVKAEVEDKLGHWSPGAALKPETPIHHDLAGIARVLETRDKKQAVIVIGFPGITLHDPDRYPLELLQEALSDLGSRLFLRIRENLGLAYYVGAQNFLGLQPGYFAFYAGTAPEKAEEVEAELLKEAELLRQEGLTEIELKRAKAKVIGQKKIARQDLGSYAMATALDELYGLGFANIDSEDAKFESVTLEQVHQAARKYINPRKCVIAIIQPGLDTPPSE